MARLVIHLPHEMLEEDQDLELEEYGPTRQKTLQRRIELAAFTIKMALLEENGLLSIPEVES